MTMNVTFKRPSLELGMEVGSLKELAGYIQEEGSELSRIFGDDMEMVVRGMGGNGGNGGEVEQGTDAGGTTGAEPAKRGRKPKAANTPDPATATAPAPLPIPGAPVDMTPNANGIPAALDRTNPAAVVNAAAPPPPPPMPPAPPAAAAPPPSGILAGKVIAALDQRATDDVNKNELVKWLAAYQIVNAGSSYDESIAAVRLMPDDKLSQVATALAVA